jgi:tetratricopeptide (TPR) repeat protein
LARLGRQPETEVRLLRSEGLLDLFAGHADLAEERFSAALRAATELFGPKSVSAATAHHGLGLAAAAEGKFERALDEYRQAQSIVGGVLGTGHPSYAGYERNAAYALRFLGRYDESRKAYARSLAALRRALGDDHPAVGVPLYFAGMLEWADDRLDDAEAKIQEARRILSKSSGEGHYNVGLCRVGLAWIHYSRKQPKPALEEAQHAEEIIRKALGSGHVDLGWPLLAEGASHLLAGAPAAAVAPLQEALEIRQNAAEAPVELALIRFELGRALWDSGRDRAAAQKLLSAALSSLRQPGRRIRAPGYPESMARELERWWAAHPEVR